MIKSLEGRKTKQNYYYYGLLNGNEMDENENRSKVKESEIIEAETGDAVIPFFEGVEKLLEIWFTTNVNATNQDGQDKESKRDLRIIPR